MWLLLAQLAPSDVTTVASGSGPYVAVVVVLLMVTSALSYAVVRLYRDNQAWARRFSALAEKSTEVATSSAALLAELADEQRLRRVLKERDR